MSLNAPIASAPPPKSILDQSKPVFLGSNQEMNGKILYKLGLTLGLDTNYIHFSDLNNIKKIFSTNSSLPFDTDDEILHLYGTTHNKTGCQNTFHISIDKKHGGLEMIEIAAQSDATTIVLSNGFALDPGSLFDQDSPTYLSELTLNSDAIIGIVDNSGNSSLLNIGTVDSLALQCGTVAKRSSLFLSNRTEDKVLFYERQDHSGANTPFTKTPIATFSTFSPAQLFSSSDIKKQFTKTIHGGYIAPQYRSGSSYNNYSR